MFENHAASSAIATVAGSERFCPVLVASAPVAAEPSADEASVRTRNMGAITFGFCASCKAKFHSNLAARISEVRHADLMRAARVRLGYGVPMTADTKPTHRTCKRRRSRLQGSTEASIVEDSGYDAQCSLPR